MKKIITFITALCVALLSAAPALALVSGNGEQYTVSYSDGVVSGNQYVLKIVCGTEDNWSDDDASVLYIASAVAQNGTVSFSAVPERKDAAVCLVYGEFSGGKSSPAVAGAISAPVVFDDVSSGAWYSDYVYTAVGMGLVDGMSRTTYSPDGSMTWAQAIKLAACMNQLYADGAVTLQNGSEKWYDTYVSYCIEKNIISAAPDDVNANITRAEYAVIFAACLPENALMEKNYVAWNAIPDVPITSDFAEAVYTLYRAGVLAGMDSETRSFSPDSNIKRSEVSAVIVRMMDRDERLSFTLG